MKKFLSIFSFALVPALSFAAPKSFKELIYDFLLPIIDQISKLLIGVAVLIFFYSIAKNLWGEQSAEKTKKMTSIAFWGILIIFVMVSIWGILIILRETLLRGL